MTRTRIKGARVIAEELKDYRRGGNRQLRFTLTDPGATAPVRSHAGDAGFDLFACEDRLVPGGSVTRVPTGVAVAFPRGWFGLIAERSSQGLDGVFTVGNVIDETFEGPISVLLMCASGGTRRVEAGEKIGQLLVLPRFVGKDERELPGRGDKGFGSTGDTA